MTQRTVLITGGNRGIGRSIAEEFIRQGHRVAVTARTGEGPSGSLTVIADVTDAASLDAAFAEVEEKLGAVEILVANAGITRDTLLMRMSDEQFEEVVNTNLNGVFRVVRRASVGMIKKKYGRIILIGSVVGLLGSAGQVNYSSTKSALSICPLSTAPPSSRQTFPGIVDTTSATEPLTTRVLGEAINCSWCSPRFPLREKIKSD